MSLAGGGQVTSSAEHVFCLTLRLGRWSDVAAVRRLPTSVWSYFAAWRSRLLLCLLLYPQTLEDLLGDSDCQFSAAMGRPSDLRRGSPHPRPTIVTDRSRLARLSRRHEAGRQDDPRTAPAQRAPASRPPREPRPSRPPSSVSSGRRPPASPFGRVLLLARGLLGVLGGRRRSSARRTDDYQSIGDVMGGLRESAGGALSARARRRAVRAL